MVGSHSGIVKNTHATMQVQLIDYAQAPLEKLYAAFRTCYSADTPIEIWQKIEAEKIGHDRIREFVGERLKTGHASPLEQVVFWFAIAGVSRSLSHQFVRHRIGISFEQQSQRYVKFKQERLAYVMPESWTRAKLDDEFAGLLQKTSELYRRALDAASGRRTVLFFLTLRGADQLSDDGEFCRDAAYLQSASVRARAMGDPADGRAHARGDQTGAARNSCVSATEMRRKPHGLLRRIAGRLD